ncbi:membrane-associated phospholipid phosphatase [Pedobacter sp. CAN_A7]|uniref:phosphatase PAP2 family protein n=1 Tax=Pedobacter sp. CAN_A7 TaxID=2787722 RepID=UPI001A2BC4A4
MAGKQVTPNEFWLANSNTITDVCSGFFYLLWIPVPLAFAAFLYFKNRRQFLHFSFTFFLVNLLGFVVYYGYPAAPPWYVQLNGFNFIAETKGNTGGLIRFDEFFNLPIFQSIYSKSSNVFAAMPSLHSSYPVIVLYYGLKNKLGLINVFFAVVMLGIWFTAIYTSHHYMLDVLAGITCALIGILLFNWIAKRKSIKKLIDQMTNAIT